MSPFQIKSKYLEAKRDSRLILSSGANINAVTVSPRGNFIVTGGKDKKVRVFDFSDVEKPAPQHDAGAPVNCLAFNPRCHWIAIGTEVGWQIWGFEAKDTPVIADGSFKLLISIYLINVYLLWCLINNLVWCLYLNYQYIKNNNKISLSNTFQ